MSVGIGVLGARSMVARLAVLPAITASHDAHLVAAASLSGAVPSPWDHATVADYDSVIAHPDVDAVYIPLPNGMHEEWVARAAAAGKHVLVEKPLAADPAAARRMQQVCSDADVLLAEAWMTPFAPRWAEIIRLATAGAIGPISDITASFTFTIGPEAADNYRWDPSQGGGALLDVGIYCLGPIVELWGSTPVSISADQTMSSSGVDARTQATLQFTDGRSATITCSFIDDETQRLELVGPDGSLFLDEEAHTGNAAAQQIRLRAPDGTDSTIDVVTADPYGLMVDAFARAVAADEPWPRPVDRSIEMLELIEAISVAANVPTTQNVTSEEDR